MGPPAQLNLCVPRCEHVGQLVNYPVLVLNGDLFRLKWTSVATVTVTNACAGVTMATFADPHSSSKLLNTPQTLAETHPHLLLKLRSFSLAFSGRDTPAVTHGEGREMNCVSKGKEG